MAIPLVALGLSSDASFIKMVCRSIRPDRFADDRNHKNEADSGYLTLKDFIMVFDKDNCLTAPYKSTIHPQIMPGFGSCCEVFGDR